MSVQLSSRLRLSVHAGEGRRLRWFCPGCDEAHQVSLDGPLRPGETNCGPWGWNGDGEAPSFTPSVNVRPAGRPADAPATVRGRCHAIITAGVISFCADSQHRLAGQSVPMPELPDWMCDGPRYDAWLRAQMGS